MDTDASLREHLRRLLAWEDAHVGFDAAVDQVPPNLRGVTPKGLPHSLWQLLEHLRIAQNDILEFCRNPAYVEPPFSTYWPSTPEPPTDGAWDATISAFRRDREALQQLAADRTLDLHARIPHGTGQTHLRELLLVADHNAYHVAQIVLVRRILGIWPS